MNRIQPRYFSYTYLHFLTNLELVVQKFSAIFNGSQVVVNPAQDLRLQIKRIVQIFFFLFRFITYKR